MNKSNFDQREFLGLAAMASMAMLLLISCVSASKSVSKNDKKDLFKHKRKLGTLGVSAISMGCMESCEARQTADD
ncbi:hypothetical protein D3C87_1103260 [compost metagenome]